jgi:hypothetical protein
MRKTGKEIARGANSGGITPDEMHTWLADAKADELQEYLRWVPAEGPLALHGRDALNVVLAKENIKLQATIKRLTIWIFILTFIMALLAFLQFYKDFINTNNTIRNTTNIKTTITNPAYTDDQSKKNQPPKHQQPPSK